MTKEEIKLKVDNLLIEILYKVSPNSKEECIDIALFIVDKILQENPTRIYYTYDDETLSAITVWNEVKQELEMLKT